MKYTTSIIALCLSMAATVFALSPTTDGTCGGSTDLTCTGGTFGDCCSPYGWCGNSSLHCGGGCQSGFGTCSGSNASPDDTCGPAFNNYHCPDNCCSRNGYCGTSGDHCGAGCQGTYSREGACLTTGIASVDGSCGGTNGYTCTGGAFDGKCCSVYGWCGDSTEHCSAASGCQAAFGAACT